jgi:hypothetical protein
MHRVDLGSDGGDEVAGEAVDLAAAGTEDAGREQAGTGASR